VLSIMINNLTTIKKHLHSLEIPETEKDILFNTFCKVEKEYLKLDFLYRRSTKDKEITINILKETVNELQHRNDYIAKINEQLTFQKDLLEEQSEQLSQNLRALQLSYKELEHFAFIASHDLKSPLRNISSYSQLLKKRYYDHIDPVANEFIDFIVNNAVMMNEIITNLLEYSRVDSNKVMEMTRLNNLLISVMENLRVDIKENNATINIGNLPEIFTYRSAIVQLFQNLIQNAIKYRSPENPYIEIGANYIADKNSWLFFVKDNGLGLDESFQDKAFQPFQRMHAKTHPGTGMGLAICRKILNLHGGEIWYKRNEGLGTTFYFTIPCEFIENNINKTAVDIVEKDVVEKIRA
jgi:light-regulated signal transduction histidine kinase (bacteriophytochrome)